MSNSTQNDHETHTACIGRIKKEGASSTCCYCNPHEGCTIGMKPTQNECPAYVPDLIGRCMNCHHYHAYPENTQNDMVYKSEVEMSRLLQQLEGMELISPKLRQDIEKACIETNRATRADARKEVKAKVVEQSKILKESITADELQSGYYLSGVKRMEKAVLATLREEEGSEK